MAAFSRCCMTVDRGLLGLHRHQLILRNGSGAVGRRGLRASARLRIQPTPEVRTGPAAPAQSAGPSGAGSMPPVPPPKRKRKFGVVTGLKASVLLTAIGYTAAVVYSQQDKEFRDVFSRYVPGAKTVTDFLIGQDGEWDTPPLADRQERHYGDYTSDGGRREGTLYDSDWPEDSGEGTSGREVGTAAGSIVSSEVTPSGQPIDYPALLPPPPAPALPPLPLPGDLVPAHPIGHDQGTGDEAPAEAEAPAGSLTADNISDVMVDEGAGGVAAVDTEERSIESQPEKDVSETAKDVPVGAEGAAGGAERADEELQEPREKPDVSPEGDAPTDGMAETAEVGAAVIRAVSSAASDVAPVVDTPKEAKDSRDDKEMVHSDGVDAAKSGEAVDVSVSPCVGGTHDVEAPLPVTLPVPADDGSQKPVVSELIEEIGRLYAQLNHHENRMKEEVAKTVERMEQEFRVRLENERAETMARTKRAGGQLLKAARQKWEKEKADLIAKHNSEVLLAQRRLEKVHEDYYRHRLEEEVRRHREVGKTALAVQVGKERADRLEVLERLYVRMKEMESLLHNHRNAYDKWQRAHEAWSLCLLIDDAVAQGLPLSVAREELVGKEGSELEKAVVDTLPQSLFVTGVASPTTLQKQLPALRTEARRAALLPDDGGTFVSYVMAVVMEKLSFLSWPAKAAGLDSGPISLEDTDRLMANAEAYLAAGDLEMATRYINQLQGWPRMVVQAWLESARARLETDQALAVLRAHCAMLAAGVRPSNAGQSS